jgi:hypothetical protein
MMKVQLPHTPGPWRTDHQFSCHSEIIGPRGQNIAQTACNLDFRELHHADARLIAAAPDLLKYT